MSEEQAPVSGPVADVIPIGKAANRPPSRADVLRAAIASFEGLRNAHGALVVVQGGDVVRARTREFHILVRQRLADPNLSAVTINAAADSVSLAPLPLYIEPERTFAAGDEWHRQLQYEGGDLKSTSDNVATFLLHHPAWRGVIAYDLFKETVVTRRVPPWHPEHRPATAKPGPWRDEDDVLLQAWFAREEGADFGVEAVRAGLSIAAGRHEFHPVRDYLEGLRWDGKARIVTFLATYFKTADTAWERSIGQAWLRSCVARIYQPGCQADHVLVIEGDQGWGKSTGLEALVPDPLWYADSGIDVTNKDSFEALRGVWIYCIGELASLAKGDVDRWKNFVTSKHDHYRQSYGHRARDFARQTVFAADTNRERYLSDATGNRRFWPGKAQGRVDVEGIRRDRDQLWAEAVATYKAGEPWWLATDVGEFLAKEQQATRMQEEPWETTVALWVAHPRREEWEEGGDGLKHRYLVPHDISRGLLVSDVLVHALKHKPDQLRGEPVNRVGAILTRLGWTSRRCEVDGVRAVRWFRGGAT